MSWVWPPPRMPVTTRIIIFLVGNPNYVTIFRLKNPPMVCRLNHEATSSGGKMPEVSGPCLETYFGSSTSRVGIYGCGIRYIYMYM